MRGRKPKPTAIKVLAGNPGQRPLNDAEPVFDGVPEPPKELSRVARKEWRRVAPQLEAAGVLKDVDRAALAAYCEAWARWLYAEKMARAQGMTVITETGYMMQSAWVTIANKALELMKAFAVEFGMTPSSRSRIKAEPVEREKSLAEVLFESVNQ